MSMKTKSILFCAIFMAFATPACADDVDRAVDGALGGAAGGLLFGPLGLVAGAVTGATAGPAISHAWGLDPSQRRAAKRRSSHTHRAPAQAEPQ